MKGLMLKDLALIKSQKQFYGMILLISVCLLLGNSSSGFVVMYVTMMAAIFTLTTVSYDDYDNGAAYLFCLPVTREEYVKEKYIFGLFASILPWTIISLFFVIVNQCKGVNVLCAEGLIPLVIYLVLVYLMLVIMLPLQIKYGGEKSRIALLLCVGCVILIVFAVVWITRRMQIDLRTVLYAFFESNGILCIAAAAVLVAVCIGVSFLLSVRIMKKKEF